MKPEDLLGKGAFEKKKTISADIELKASEQPYAIIPCTFYPDTENSFSVSVTPSTSPSDLRLRACADDWRKAVASVSQRLTSPHSAHHVLVLTTPLQFAQSLPKCHTGPMGEG